MVSTPRQGWVSQDPGNDVRSVPDPGLLLRGEESLICHGATRTAARKLDGAVGNRPAGEGSDMADKWHYAQDDMEFGPYSAGDLKGLAAAGTLRRTATVW